MENGRERHSVALKHGLSAMKRAVRELGTRAIDGRTSVAKSLSQWRRELIDNLGGRETISTQQAAIVDLATKTKLILDSVDVWLLAQPSLVDKRRRAILPVVRERQQLADALARYLVQLGLERRQPPALSLADVVAEITAEKERSAGNERTERPLAVHIDTTVSAENLSHAVPIVVEAAAEGSSNQITTTQKGKA